MVGQKEAKRQRVITRRSGLLINRASYFWWGTINHLMGVNSTDLSSGAFQTTSSPLKKLSMTTPFGMESNKTGGNDLNRSNNKRRAISPAAKLREIQFRRETRPTADEIQNRR